MAKWDRKEKVVIWKEKKKKQDKVWSKKTVWPVCLDENAKKVFKNLTHPHESSCRPGPLIAW